VSVYSVKSEILQFTYDELPIEWQNLNFEVDDETFWIQLFTGLDNIIMTNRSLWLPIAIISFIFVYSILVLFEILLDSFIIRIFRFGQHKFKQIFVIVTYSMTIYVILRVILDLWGVNVGGIMLSLFQMTPLVYALIALRNAYRE